MLSFSHRIFPPPPAIEAVPKCVHRPLWSIMIPARDRVDLLIETLRSVLAQDEGPEAMQIEVIDNSATIETIPQCVAVLAGNRVTVRRQPKPVGMAENWNTCIQRATGQLVHLLHDDDLVLPGFYSSLARAKAKAPTAGAFFVRSQVIDDAGVWLEDYRLLQDYSGLLPDPPSVLAPRQNIQAPAMVVSRWVYEQVGGFRPDLVHALDWEMWVRIGCRFPIWYEPKILVAYRVHSASDTSSVLRSAANIADSRRAIDIFRHHLPIAKARTLTRYARIEIARYGIYLATRFVGERNIPAVLRQVTAALRTSIAPRVLADVGRLLLVGSGRTTIRLWRWIFGPPGSAKTH